MDNKEGKYLEDRKLAKSHQGQDLKTKIINPFHLKDFPFGRKLLGYSGHTGSLRKSSSETAVSRDCKQLLLGTENITQDTEARGGFVPL